MSTKEGRREKGLGAPAVSGRGGGKSVEVLEFSSHGGRCPVDFRSLPLGSGNKL